MNQRFVFSGGPGAGKTTLLAALAKRGYPFVSESARAIIRERLQQGLPPRPAAAQFAGDILQRDIMQYQNTPVLDQWVFFDRGVVDALYMLQDCGALTPQEKAHYLADYSYNSVAFVIPPWQEIYRTDSERDQTYAESVQVFEKLSHWYSACQYQLIEVPRVSVNDRVDFVLKTIQQRLN